MYQILAHKNKYFDECNFQETYNFFFLDAVSLKTQHGETFIRGEGGYNCTIGDMNIWTISDHIRTIVLRRDFLKVVVKNF